MSNSNVLIKIYEHAINRSEAIALINPLSNPAKMTYGELFRNASILSKYIVDNSSDNAPIIVYGHKNPYMIVCFLACVMSGHPYCPVDISMPDERVEMILDQTNSEIMFAIEPYYTEKTRVISVSDIARMCETELDPAPGIPATCVKGNQTFYVIFTSGSTGKPKGVEISANALNNFLIWSSELGDEKVYGEKTVFLNQAPFSFDLSVMDLYTSLYCGATLCMMDRRVQRDLAAITPFIKGNGINAIVATPSFASMCLIDKGFCAENIPTLESFIFCGETLSNKTARKLLTRFPNAVVQNTYGPTESTVAVSDVRITMEIIENYDPLPVGKAKPGTTFIISDNEKREEDGHQIGEVLITGDTLAKGYFKREDLTHRAFINYQTGDKMIRAYRTGDLGYIDNNQLFYCGRIDLQIKLNGYRIELGDIESCILKQEFIENCTVVPKMNDGKVKALVGVIVLSDKNLTEERAKEAIKASLYKQVPGYMVPQNYVFIDAIPMTNNGKVNRDKLKELIEED